MGKINKNFTLDHQIVERLKEEENASQLVEGLLNSHFNYLDSDNVELLNNKKLELEEKIEMMTKEREHVLNRLILLGQKKKQEHYSEKVKEKIVEIKSEAEELNQKWRDGYFDTGKYDEVNDEYEGHQEYWDKIKAIQNKKEDTKEEVKEEATSFFKEIRNDN